MSAIPLVAALDRIPIFSGLGQRQLAELARRAERIIFKPGDVVVEESAAGNAAYLIVDGEALRTSGPDLDDVAETVPAGALIGELAMLTEYNYGSTIIAVTKVRALMLTREALAAAIAADAQLADHLIGFMSRRLEEAAAELRRIDARVSDDIEHVERWTVAAKPAAAAELAVH